MFSPVFINFFDEGIKPAQKFRVALAYRPADRLESERRIQEDQFPFPALPDGHRVGGRIVDKSIDFAIEDLCYTLLFGFDREVLGFWYMGLDCGFAGGALFRSDFKFWIIQITVRFYSVF